MCEHKKLVSVVVPIYNEESMVTEICERVAAVFEKLENYAYELVFFDDGSTDGTRCAIEAACAGSENVKGVFYARNFGYLKSTFYCMQQAKGDCAIILHADLQNPPEKIPEFIEKWERGAQVVLGVKNKSLENRFVYFLRTIFYFLMIRVFGIKIRPHATEFELFDKNFVAVLREIKTNTPFLRGIISEYAGKTDCVYYTQDARKKGKSKFNLNKYYDFAICGITQYSVFLPRKVIAVSLGLLALLVGESCFTLIPLLGNTDLLTIMNAVVLRCILAVLCLMVMTLSVVWEYVIHMIRNNTEKPLIVEEKRLGY